MIFRQLIDYETKTFTYLLADRLRRKAVLIDPVLGQVERDLNLLNEMGLNLEFTLETGIHGDHLSGAAMLRAKTGCKVTAPANANTTGADQLISHGEAIFFGLHALEVRAAPGRTASNLIYVTSDISHAFVGSTLLIRDLGRVDHPDSDVDQLYHSLWDQILTLPDDTKLYPGRDYHGRTVTTVYEERHNNPFIKGKPSQEEFVRRVKARNLPPRSETKIDANKAQNRIFLPKESLEKIAPSDSWAPIERTLVGIPEVTVEWVHDFPRNYRIIDVRGTEEFTGPLGHIENAELVPLDTLATEARNWDPSQRYVAVCRSGGRSGRAATILESLGFTMVASMAGGMLHWNELYPQQ